MPVKFFLEVARMILSFQFTIYQFVHSESSAVTSALALVVVAIYGSFAE
jgi:hypothetical protein